MMRRIRNVVGILCIGMALVMAVAGCSQMKKQKNADSKDGQEPVVEEQASDKVEKAERVENGELEFDSTVLSVGKEKVSFREVLAYMYWLKASYEPRFGDGIWNYPIQGQTLERKSLEEVLHMLTEMKIIRREAEAVPLDLTVDEADEINVKAENVMAGIPPEDVDRFGLTAEVLATVLRDNEIAGKMFDVSMNEVNTQITDEEAKQMVVQYLLVMTDGTNRNGVRIEMNDEQRAKAHERAKDLRKKAAKADSFYSFAESNTDADVVESTIGRRSMSEEFVNASWGLKTGEFSGVVEAPEGYYVIYCVNEFDEKATKQEKERVILEEQTNVFEKQYEEWAGKYQVRISNLLWDYDYFSYLTNE